jgi:hypothetical protein
MAVTVRQPVLEVYIDGELDARARAATCSFGYDQRYAEARVLRAGGTGYPSDPAALPIEYWSDVEIKMGATPATVETRFRGWVVPLSNDLWPQQGTLICKGKLYLAEFVKNEVTNGTNLSGAGAGMADEDQVQAVLTQCGVSFTAGNILGTGHLLGSRFRDLAAIGASPFGPFTPPTPFWWREGETGLSYIEQLDAISVPVDYSGRYRTFESLDGTVYRIKLSTQPAGTADFSFVEGTDILPGASIERDPSGAANRVVVTGAPHYSGLGSYQYTAKAPVGVLASPYIPSVVPVSADGYRQVSASPFSSLMIEKALIADTGDVVSCEQVANLLLAENNAVLDTLRVATPRDDLLGPGQTIAFTSPRLGIDAGERYWLQHLEVEVDERGTFRQRMTATRRT